MKPSPASGEGRRGSGGCDGPGCAWLCPGAGDRRHLSRLNAKPARAGGGRVGTSIRVPGWRQP